MVTFDTNIAVYAFSDVDPKAEIAADILAQASFISVQLLNEFTNVMRNKRKLDFSRISIMREQIIDIVNEVYPIDKYVSDNGMRIAERYGLSLYDALMIAVALKNGAITFYSEDMQNGLVIDGRMTISDPFIQMETL